MKMTAAVLRRADAPRPFAESRPISIEEVELDPPGPGELLAGNPGTVTDFFVWHSWTAPLS